MTFPRTRAVVAGLLFLGWLGFLLWLVLQSRNLIVLSRPQFLVATAYVIADVQDVEGKPSPHVVVNEVVWTADAADQGLAGKSLDVPNLSADGYQGPGPYILPLWKTRAGYAVTPVPPAPGFHVPAARIYPLTSQTRAQLDEIMAQR